MTRLLNGIFNIWKTRSRRSLAVLLAVLTLTSCTAGSTVDKAIAEPIIKLNSEVKPLTVDLGTLKQKVYPTFLQREQLKAEKLSKNAIRIDAAIKVLKKTAGHTWYVFSGATPQGWDCSGLVVWFYGNLGVTLEHRASIQARSGKIVKKPMIGDIVAFYYHGSNTAHHVGIYIGNGKFISAPRPGQVTTIERIADNQFTRDGSYIRYVRVVEQKRLSAGA